MQIRLLATTVLFAALAFAAPSAASAKLKTETATGGAVQAVLTYNVKSQLIFDVTDTHLTITRNGATVLDTNVPEPCNGCGVAPAGAGGGSAKSLRIADLDGDGEPEVLLDIYTGGAHCCLDTWIYRFTGSSYTGTPALWGDVGYTLKDLDGDGVPELRSFDDRFAYVFTAYAASWFPPQIWQFRAGVLNNVTRSYPKIVRADAKRALRTYRHEKKVDVRGVLAGYVADEYLLGHGATGWKLVRSALKHGYLNGFGRGDAWPRNGRYVRSLRKFLRKTGYIS